MPLSNLALVTVTQGLPQNAPLNCLATGGICIGAHLPQTPATAVHYPLMGCFAEQVLSCMTRVSARLS